MNDFLISILPQQDVTSVCVYSKYAFICLLRCERWSGKLEPESHPKPECLSPLGVNFHPVYLTLAEKVSRHYHVTKTHRGEGQLQTNE